jgi:hypothetical protein
MKRRKNLISNRKGKCKSETLTLVDLKSAKDPGKGTYQWAPTSPSPPLVPPWASITWERPRRAAAALCRVARSGNGRSRKAARRRRVHPRTSTHISERAHSGAIFFFVLPWVAHLFGPHGLGLGKKMEEESRGGGAGGLVSGDACPRRRRRTPVAGHPTAAACAGLL